MSEKCKHCGDYINWNDPMIHYGGHTCSEEGLIKNNATKRFLKSIEENYCPPIPVSVDKLHPRSEENNKNNESLADLIRLIVRDEIRNMLKDFSNALKVKEENTRG